MGKITRVETLTHQCLGTIEEESSGYKTVRNFTGQILATYNPTDNTTRKFGGEIVCFGDIAGGFLLGR